MVHVNVWIENVTSEGRGRTFLSQTELGEARIDAILDFGEAEFKKIDVNGGGIVLFDESLGRFESQAWQDQKPICIHLCPAF